MLSSDDAFLPEKLQKQVDFLRGHPQVPAVFTWVRLVGEQGEPFAVEDHPYARLFDEPNRDRHAWLRRFFFQGNCLCHPSVLIRREHYRDIGTYDERMANLPDFDFWVRTCLKREIHILPDELVRFRIRSGEANASGDRPDAVNRLSFETGHVLRHFLSITQLEDFQRIFPGVEVLDAAFLPFHLAMLALEVPHNAYRHFALTVLFESLGDPLLAGRLASECGFHPHDLIRLTGAHDLHGAQEAASLRAELRELLTRQDQHLRLINSLQSHWSWRFVKRLTRVRNAV